MTAPPGQNVAAQGLNETAENLINSLPPQKKINKNNMYTPARDFNLAMAWDKANIKITDSGNPDGNPDSNPDGNPDGNPDSPDELRLNADGSAPGTSGMQRSAHKKAKIARLKIQMLLALDLSHRQKSPILGIIQRFLNRQLII